MEKWRKRIGYGVGDLGCNLVSGMMASYILIFYTDVYGISAGAAGILMLLTQIVGGFADIGTGLAVDKTKSRWGQSRPFFLYGAVPFALCTVLCFYVPDFSANGKLVWAYVTYTLLCVVYAIENMPLNSILPRLSADPHERNCMVSTRMVCAAIGMAIVMTATTPLVEFLGKGDAQRGYFLTAIIYGLGAMGLSLVAFFNTKEVVPPSSGTKKVPLKESIKGLNGQVAVLITMVLAFYIIYIARNTAAIYYFTYNLQKKEWLFLVGILGVLSGIPMLLVLPSIQKRYGKKAGLVLNVFIYVTGSLMMFVGKNNTLLTLSGLFLTGLSAYGMMSSIFAMQPDIVEYSEKKSGVSVAGLISGLQGIATKVSMGVAGAMIGFALTASGYVANSDQGAKTLSVIEVCYIWLPLVMAVFVGFVGVKFYKLDKQKVETEQVAETLMLTKEKLTIKEKVEVD